MGTKGFVIGKYSGVVWRADKEDGRLAPILEALAPFVPRAVERIIANVHWRYWGFHIKVGESLSLEGAIAKSGPLTFASVEVVYGDESDLVSSVILSSGYDLVRGYGKGRLAKLIIRAINHVLEETCK